jgi:GTP-binding protein HflX
LRFPRDLEVIITDTVGFIRDLPPDLIAAFQATLDELHDADLLLHVVDVSSPYIDDHIQAVETILTELNLGDIPQLIVLNKADLVSPEIAANLARLYQGVVISAHDSDTLSPLIHCLQDLLGEKITEESGVSGTAAAVGEP